VLGGNGFRCHGRLSEARYPIPDSSKGLQHRVPVSICADDSTQQQVALSGLLYASHFKLKQVAAPGQDPLARGWTRGGEVYMWVTKDGLPERCMPIVPVSDRMQPVASVLSHTA